MKPKKSTALTINHLKKFFIKRYLKFRKLENHAAWLTYGRNHASKVSSIKAVLIFLLIVGALRHFLNV